MVPITPILSVEGTFTQSHIQPHRDGQSNSAKIPPEIWLEVFLYATWVPGAFLTSDDHDVTGSTLNKNGAALHIRFRCAMDVNLSVSLVCKTWNALVPNTLFRYILVKNGDQALRIADMLENRKSSPHVAHRPGWWTNRLEIALDGTQPWTSIHTQAVARIIHHCPNLAVLSNAFCATDNQPFFPAIFDTFPITHGHSTQTLRQLELKGDAAWLAAVIAMLASSLEILYLRPVRAAGFKQQSWTCHLPRLHTLISEFPHGLSPTIGWDMPSLETLMMDDQLELQTCAQKYGHQLRHLSLPYPYFLTTSLSSLCPNLHELAIDFHNFHMEISFDSLNTHTSLRCIVIQNPILSAALPLGSHDTLRSALSSLTTLPSLRCLRFQLPLRNPVPTPPFSMWASWLERCQIQGITVQYCRGAEGRATWRPFTKEFIQHDL